MRTVFLVLAICLVQVAQASAASENQKLICFKYSSFRLAPGEATDGHGAGAEAITVSISGPSGEYEIGESEIFRRDQKGKQVYEGNGVRVHRMNGDPIAYMAYGKAFGSEDVPIFMLNGSALSGDERDAAIYSRIAISDPSRLKCDETYNYSWEEILGGSK